MFKTDSLFYECLKNIRTQIYRTSSIQFSGVNILNERAVISWVPVQAVANSIKRNSVKEIVDWGNNLEWKKNR